MSGWAVARGVVMLLAAPSAVLVAATRLNPYRTLP